MNGDKSEMSRYKGRKEQSLETARNFYTNGASLELITKSLNMTKEQVKKSNMRARDPAPLRRVADYAETKVSTLTKRRNAFPARNRTVVSYFFVAATTIDT